MATLDGQPPVPAVGTIGIQIWAEILTGADVWDTAKWDTGVWAGGAWQDVTPQSMNAQITWGSDDNQGALSLPSAGSWSIVTYDPQRVLDPANTASPFTKYLKPGGMVRVTFLGNPVRVGFIDEVEYDMETQQGSIRATDGVSYMVKAKLPAGLAHDTSVPLSLRARARWALEKAQVSKLITVEADPAGELDPAVGLALDTASSVWEQIATAAFDALYAVWLDRNGILRFRYFGSPVWSGVTLGGLSADAIPIETVTTKLSMLGVYNHISAYGDPRPDDFMEVKNQASIDAYGDLLLTRDRRNPDAWAWVLQLLQDRGNAAVQYEVGTIRPQSNAQMEQILDLGVASTCIVRVNSRGTPVNVWANVLGGSIEANVDTGWSAKLMTYFPSATWYTKPKTKQLRYPTVKGLEIWTTVAGGNYGSASSAQQVVLLSDFGEPADEKHFVLMGFPPINFTGITKIVSAVLRAYRPYHQHAEQIREEGWVRIKRITAAWDEGDVWPGPAVEPTTPQNYNYTSDLDVWIETDITTIVKAWAPASIPGGLALPQHGIRLEPYWANTQGEDIEHLMISTKLSSMPAYIIIQAEV